MMKKLMSLGLVGILSASLMVGCSSNDSKDDDTVTIKYVDENGNVKREKVTKEEAKEIEQNQKQQTNDNTKKQTTKEQPNKKEQPKDEDDMTEDEMYEKGLIKKHGGHLEEEAKKQEKMHEAEDNNEDKYPIRYDADGTQINDEYGNYTPEYEHKKEEQEKHQQYYDEDEDYPGKGILDPDDTSNIDSDVEESPSETIEQN